MYNFRLSIVVRSRLSCGGLCQLEPECLVFHLSDDQTCELGSWYTNCYEAEGDGGTVALQDVGQGIQLKSGQIGNLLLCSPHIIFNNILNCVVHEYTIESAEDKSSVIATSPLNLYHASLVPAGIVDGNPSGNTFHPIVALSYPWVQVTLPKEAWVKGIKMHARPNLNRQEFYEVKT